MLRSPLPHFAFILTAACLLSSSAALADLRQPTASLAFGETQYLTRSAAEIERAQQAFDELEFATAIENAERALRHYSTRSQRHVALYLVYASHERLGDLEEALRHCNRAVRLGGRLKWQHLNNCARVRILLGDFEGAIADLRTGMSLVAPNQATRVFTASGRPAGHETLAQNLDIAIRWQASSAPSVAERRRGSAPAKRGAPERSADGTVGVSPIESIPAAPAR